MIALIRFVLAILGSPFKSKSRLEAENAALRQQLIVLRRRVKGGADSRTPIAGFSSSSIGGFRRSSRSLRSSVPRRWCVGIVPASVVIGGGNQGDKAGDLGFRQSCER